MVAVVSGTGLGLFATSLTQIGAGLGGGSSIGGSRTDQHVNVATGNLILTGWDESLFGHGMATGLVRTYNSQGALPQMGADGWQTGYERTVRLASGTVNTAGSTVERATADGAVVTYAWDGVAYVSTTGDGAHDTIKLSASKWLWTEGSTQVQETYTASTPSTAGKLEKIVDLATMATYTFSYSGNQLNFITGTNGETLEFTYDAGRLTGVGTRERDANNVLVLKGQVSYGYDDVGRLSWVRTDLTPDNAADNTWDGAVAANNDGKSYRVSYTYADASSLRITGVSTSDGITVAYTYSGDRIASVTQGSASDGSAQTLSYTYGANETTITDGSGRSWTYQFDAARQLTAVLDPAINGQRAVTQYTYDAAGNVTRIRQAAYAGATSSLDTVYQYDSKGNLLKQRDQLGNTVQREYTSENRLKIETRYTVADADGLDPTHGGTSNLPSGALITRYVYDSTNPLLLRFVISATGEVTETQYNPSGVAQGLAKVVRRFVADRYDISGLGATSVPGLSNMTSWIDHKEDSTARIEFTYDTQGRLSQQTEFAAVSSTGSGSFNTATSITRYTYDAQGMLRQQLTVRGTGRTLTGGAPSGSEVVDYVYDGLGRLLSTIRRDSSAAANDDVATVTTTTAYLDSGHKVVTTLDSGMVRTELRNAAGQLVSLSDAGTVAGTLVTRAAQNIYDATGRLRATQDDTGARTYFFYDGAGRLSATVDATGSVTRTLYDAIGRVSGTMAYATRVATSGWYSGGSVTKDTLTYAASQPALAGNEAWVETDAANDRTATRTYDAAGRLATEIDAAGLTTVYAYDGAGRLLSTTSSKPGDPTEVPRLTRYFYDAADRVIATLDPGGRVVENFYDAGGRLAQVKRYAGTTPNALRAAGTLDQLRPIADTANDQVERYLYDGRGNQVGAVNAEGYFTEFVYDEAANQRAVKEYAKKLTGLSGSETLATLRTTAMSSAPVEASRLTQRSFNGLGQLVTELNAEGRVTRFSYDEAGRLVRTEVAQGTSEVREGYSRYDVFGQLIGEMSGAQAAVAMAALGNKSLNDATVTEAQLNGVYAQYGVRHSYDLLGRRTESIDASGAKTFYFYDAAGQQRFTVRGVKDNNGIANAQGEVTEMRYSAFGQVIEELAYTGRIAIPVAGSRASVESAISTLNFVTATDTRRLYAYDQRGLMTRLTNAEGAQTAMSYSAFGQLYELTTAYGTAEASTTRYLYNPRGMMMNQTDAYGTSLARTTILAYDAFGNVTTSTDGRGVPNNFTYDRLGRQVTMSRTVSGQVESTSTTYDAFDRVTSQTDARGNVTTYAHSDTARSLVMTTQEGVSFTTVHNAFGQTVSVTQTLPGGGTATTTTTYDKNGATLSVVDALGNAASNAYDVRGLLTESSDASGRKVQYTYDAVGRVLTRVEDPGKLNLTTAYVYDGQGRQLSVTDASMRVTQLSYDREGRLTQVAKDPAGLNLRTVTNYDVTGRVFKVTEGFGTAAATTVQYVYDVLGRRTSETVAPGTLNLTTSYAYDAGDNLVTRTDALTNATRYAYDEAGRLRFEIDATGAVTETGYDKNGNAILSRSYAKRFSAGGVSSLGTAPTLAAVQALVASESLLNNAADQLAYRVLDRDDRVRFVVDAMGGLSETIYDSAGRVQQTLSYTALFVDTTVVAKLRAGTAAVSDFTTFVSANQGAARASQYVYDVAGRVVYTLLRNDVGQALVSERRYDASGRAVADVAYAKTIAYTVGQTAAQVASAVTVAGGDAANQQRLTRYAYDAAGRLRFTLDDAGAVTETRYDAAGRVASTRVYKTAISVVNASEAVIATAVATLPDARRTAYVYDAAGRLSSTTDAHDKTEYYGYDAAGRRTSFTNKLNALWTYEYDAAGRMTVERSPVVSVSRYDAGGTVVTTPVSIVTRRTYDALGHVLTVTENADTAEARTITYEYDARGRQVRTIFPDAWQVNAAGVLVATGSTPQITVTYDALDRAVVQKDVRDKYSYKVYDSQGQLAYDVDEAGYVTAYTYDAFGEQTSVRRYANKINFSQLNGNGWSAGQAITLAQISATGVLTADANADRILTTTFDRLGRKTSVVQPAVAYYKADGSFVPAGSPTTQFVYDAYGNLIKERQLLEGTSGQPDAVWADTFRYYDELGRLIRSVDAEGYVTAWQYDALGQVTIQAEFARKIATAGLDAVVLAPLPTTGVLSTGYDRFVTSEYDDLGRKTLERTLRFSQTAQVNGGILTVNNASPAIDTIFNYDEEGRLTSTTVDGDLVTGVIYDALGRATSTTEAQRKVLRSDWQSILLADVGVDLTSASLYVDAAPYTTMQYDAFGNAIRVVRYAAGDPAIGNPDQNNLSNAVTTIRYDRQGRAVITRDAGGTAWYSRYDAADHVLDAWYTLSGNSGDATVHTLAEYDELGRQTTAQTTRTIGANPPVADSSTAVKYNAFGEITAQGDTLAALDLATTSKRYTYDKAGRMVSSNAETGTNRSFYYNLAGHQVREERPWTNNGSAVSAVYVTKTDKLGRAVAQIVPSWNADAYATTQVGFELDRWGNVLRQVDARNNLTEYSYNDRNQLIRQVAPRVKVIDEAGNESWETPETRWLYDELGRLIATVDANDHVRRYEYDAAGQLVKTIDATTAVSLQGFDALGRQVATQNPVGYLAYVEYDKLDRAIAQGDFANPTPTTRSKTALQTFLLDQNGNRKQVTDATGRWTKYDYDSRALLLRSETGAGVVNTFEYDAQGHKKKSTDGLGASNTWLYDAFGRVTDHVDLGGANYDYTYDVNSGLQTNSSSNRVVTVSAPGGRYTKDIGELDDPLGGIEVTRQVLNRSTQYYANGQVRQINDGDGIYYYFEYDAAGNRTLEETKTVDGQGKVIRTVTHLAYDSNNRISRVTTQDMMDGGRYTLDLSYDYDAVGNRRRVVANSAYGSAASPLDVGNRAPIVVTPPANKSVKAGAVVEWALDASAHFIDPDGTPLSYQLKLANGDPIPSWLHMTFDAASGQLRFRADAASPVTTLNLRLTATDSPELGSPISVIADFTLSMVVNTAPTATSIGTQTAHATGLVWSYTIPEGTFSDVDGDTLSYVATIMPPWMSFDIVTRTFSGIPSTAGSWQVTVTATDSSGATKPITFTVITPDVAPFVSSPLPDHTVVAGRPWSFKLPAETFTDRNGQGTLNYSVSVSGSPGSWITFDQGTRTFSGTAPTTGTWTVTVTASDGQVSASDSFQVSIGNVQNQSPIVASPITDQVGIAPGSNWNYTFPVGTFTDAEGAALSYTVIGMPVEWMSFSQSLRKFTGIAPAQGTWDITVIASDGNLTASDTFRVSIGAPQNQLPNLVNPIPDQQGITPGSNWSFTVPSNTFSDPEGAALIYTVTGMPGEWMSFDPLLRKFSGIAPATGSWSITIRASDGAQSITDTFQVSISGASNQAPTATTILPQSTVVNQVWSFPLPAGTFSDPNGDTLTYSLNPPVSWLGINAATGAVTGTPTSTGTVQITIRADDGRGESATTSFNLTINAAANQLPFVASPIGPQTAVANQAWSFPLPAGTFSDPDNHTLTYSLDPAVSWLQINTSTGALTGTPTSPGLVQIKIRADDGHGGSAIATFNLTISAPANQAPSVVAPIPDQPAYATGGVWSYIVPAGTFTDPEGGTLTYTATGRPPWLGFDPATRTFSGTPQGAGSWTITVTAQDPAGNTVSDDFVVTTPNEAPVRGASIQDQTATVGQAFTLTFAPFTDANNDPLTYTVTGRPSWLNFDPVTRTLSGTPTAGSGGTYPLVARANDGTVVTIDSFDLTVTDPSNSAPVVSNPLVNQTSTSLNYTFAANTFVDPNGDTLAYSYDVTPDPRREHATLSFNSTTRKFTGSRPSTKSFVITVTASDGNGGTASASFTWGPSGSSLLAGSGDLMDAMQATQMQVETDEYLQMLPGDPEDPGDPGGGGGGGPTLSPNTQTLWFKYDEENRVQVVNGALVNGQVVVAAKQANSDLESYALQYNAAGLATTRTTVNATGVAQVTQSIYTARGQLGLQYATVNVGDSTGAVVAKHIYDDAGREVEVRRYYAPDETVNSRRVEIDEFGEIIRYTVSVQVGGWLKHATLTSYDNDGRVDVVTEKGRAGNFASNFDPEADPAEQPEQSSDLGVLSTLSKVTYRNGSNLLGSGYDAAGRLGTYRYEHLNGYQETNPVYTHTYTTSYQARDTYLEASVSGISAGDPNYKPTTTTSTYDSAGRRTAITQTTPITGQPSLTNLRYFSYDANGGILTRRDGNLTNNTFQETLNSRKYFAYANGQQVAALGNDGKIDTASQLTAFSSSDMGAEPTLVLEGDTLQSIAQRVYGNSSLWYVLAAANAVTDADLVAGTTLKAPQVTTSANDANTFKPYDPNSILGPTTPSLPYITPPQKLGCDTMAMVVRIFATVVTLVTGQWYAAAAAAGIGETVAQTVEIQDGYRQGYNWAQVGTSAIMAGFGASETGQSMFAGMRASASAVTAFAGRFAYGATMAVASDAVNYALSKAMGYETHFSLRNTAANGIASGVSAGLFGLPPGQGGAPVSGAFSWAAVAMKAVARQGISYGVHKAIEGHASWNTGQVIGNAIGDAVGTALGAVVSREQARASQGYRPELTMVGIQQEILGIDVGPLQLLPPPRLSNGTLGSQSGTGVVGIYGSASTHSRSEEIARIRGDFLNDVNKWSPTSEMFSKHENNFDMWATHPQLQALIPMPSADGDPDAWRRIALPVHDAYKEASPDHTDTRRHDATPGELTAQYIGNALDGVANVVADAVMGGVDLGIKTPLDLASAGYGALTGRDVQMYGSIGRAALNGASTGDIVTNMNPMLHLMIWGDQVNQAYQNRDFKTLSYKAGQALGTIAMAYVGTKVGNPTFGEVAAPRPLGFRAAPAIEGRGIPSSEAVSAGELLRQKYSALSPAARQARITELSEAVYARRISEFESSHGTKNAHSISDHGSQTTIAKQGQRIYTGISPGGRTSAYTSSASRFANNSDHYWAMDKAYAQQLDALGNGLVMDQQVVTLGGGRVIGNGVFRNGSISNATMTTFFDGTRAVFRFDANDPSKFYTGYVLR